jgi:hypothetical protein
VEWAFGFGFTGISNQTAIIEFIEFSPSLTPLAWAPVQTNLLQGSPQYFFDEAYNRNGNGSYRIHSP